MKENGKHSPKVAYVIGVHETRDILQTFDEETDGIWGVGLCLPYRVEPEDLGELEGMLHTAAQSWCHGMNRKRILER